MGDTRRLPARARIPGSGDLSTELRYREMVETVNAIMWRCDAQTFQFTFVNHYAETLLGYPLERWTTEPSFWRDHVHPDDRDWAMSFCTKATQEKRSHEFAYRMIAADGRTVWLRDATHVVLEHGEPKELFGVMVDITEGKRAEESLRESESLFRQVADNMRETSHAPR